MDNGISLQLRDVAFTSPGMPKLRKDAILSDGSLMLVDFGHSLGKVGTVPSQGQNVINIADDLTRRLLGTSDPTHPTADTLGASSIMVAELSTKGGVHVMSTRSGQTSNGYWAAKFNPAVLAYLVANPNHRYYKQLIRYEV